MEVYLQVISPISRNRDFSENIDCRASHFSSTFAPRILLFVWAKQKYHISGTKKDIKIVKSAVKTTPMQ